MNSVIVGASSGLGRALSYRLAERGINQILISSDNRDLSALSSDLMIRFNIKAESLSIDFGESKDYAFVLGSIFQKFNEIEYIFIPIGISLDEDRFESQLLNAEYLINVNLISVIKIIDVLVNNPNGNKIKVIVGFGSIASIRGRGNNIIYSASKRALESYFESLRHTLQKQRVLVQFYVLGYLQTNLSFGKKTLLPKASVKKLSKKIIKNLNKKAGIQYYPHYWLWISIIIKKLPWFIFKRFNF
jgi:short-subunit dehydrogenase